MIRRLLNKITQFFQREEPLDFGNHGIIAHRSDGSYQALTDDEMWNMRIETELAIEDYWDDAFARAYCQYGAGIMAIH